MIPVADPFMAGVRPGGIQRGRGGFLRSKDGAPYVSDPSGTTVASGSRKGEVKRMKYGSPSSAGTLIENDVGLTKHKQRNTFLGIGMSEDLREACRALVDMDHGSDEFTKAADTIVIEADKLTRSWLAADRGTHGHLLCELFDREQPLTDEIVEAGETLGLGRDTQRAVIGAWRDLLADNGLEILAVESSCVDDKWRLAGTLDRIVRCTKPLTFVKPGGELVVVPADTVLILDLKFGKTRKAHPIQIASYAQSVPYDTDTEVRGVWPWPIDQTHALIAHGDFGDEFRPVSIELVWVDLVAGRNHGGQCVVAAKAWAARDDVFSVAQIVEGVEPPVTQATATPSTPSSAGMPDPSAPLTVGEEAGAAAGHSPAMTTVEAALWSHSTLTVDPSRLALIDARGQLCATPDEGADLGDGEFGELWDRLKAEFDALDDDGRKWRSEMVTTAIQRHVPFHVQQVQTVRTYHLNKAVITLALVGMNDEVVRAILALIVGEVALFPSIQTGHLIGSLGAVEAERFAELADLYVDNQLTAYVEDGCLRYRQPFSPLPAA